jgi:hypothetical protein
MGTNTQGAPATQGFFASVGAAAPAPVYTLQASPTVYQSVATPNIGTITYNNSANNYSVQIVYTLTGGTPGSYTSEILDNVTVKNNSTTTNLNLHFYEYQNFNITGSGGFYNTLTADATGATNQTSGIASLTSGNSALYPGANSGNPDEYEAGKTSTFVSGPGATPNVVLPSTLNDNGGPVSYDVAAAYEWDASIAPSSTFNYSGQINVTVPEPTSASLTVVGTSSAALLRRRRRALVA